MNVGHIMSTVGVFSTVGDIISIVGYLEHRRGYSVPWRNIMMHVGDIMSTVGGYHLL